MPRSGWTALLALLSACAAINPDFIDGAESGTSRTEGPEATSEASGESEESGESESEESGETGEDTDMAPASCPGSEAFCEGEGSYCGPEGLLVTCVYLDSQDCIAHEVSDCELELEPGASCEDGACVPPHTDIDLANMCELDALELIGDASCYVDAQNVELGVSVAQAMEFTAGAALHAEPVRFGAGFSTSFSFVIENVGGITDANGFLGADGMAFLIHDDPNYEPGFMGFGQLANSVAVEFDTWKNGTEDSSNHIGIMRDGVLEHGPAHPEIEVPGDFEDGSTWFAWIDYDGATLEVYLSPTGTKPDTPTHAEVLDIAGIVGTGIGRVGFAGSTGEGFENFVVRSWTYYGEGS